MNSIKKTDHFYLIDGSGYIFRAYYALPPLSRKSDGLPTGAVNGFCTMLHKLLEQSRSDDSKNKPTEQACTDGLATLQSNFDNKEYQRDRANEYPSIVDQLDDIYHNGIDAWKATIKATKDKYPKR